MRYHVTVDGQEYQIEILDEQHARIGNQVHAIDFVSISNQPVYSLIIDGKSFEAYVYPEESGWQVLLAGRQYPIQVVDEREKRLGTVGEGSPGSRAEFLLKAPMPGLVVAVPVKEGQPVEKGQILLILESMKMQNELRSPRSGSVSRLRVKAGDSVEQKQLLLGVL
jgi:biotin carboxyl carrier protein